MATAFQALVPYFGAKRAMAQTIIETIGEHRAYWEPFCGSMAVLLAKPQVSHETVNDLNGDVINLAMYLQDVSTAEGLYRSLVGTCHCEPIYREAQERLRQPIDRAAMPDPVRAMQYMITSWQGMNGLAGIADKRAAFALRWTAGGGHQGARWRRVVDSIPAWHERLRGVTIIHRDAFDVLAKIRDEARTAIYCDPPYVRQSRGSAERYLHDFRQDLVHDDHSRLADALARFKQARVVVSYYDCPLVRDLYSGWHIIPATRRKDLANTGGTKARAGGAAELLITNDV